MRSRPFRRGSSDAYPLFRTADCATQSGPEQRANAAPALTTAKGHFAMAKKPLPTPDQLRQLLDYDPETGVLSWRARGPEWFNDTNYSAQGNANNWNAKYAGTRAGSVNAASGYRYITVKGRHILAHRAIWAILNGEWPICIDHIDRSRDNNAARNLRNVTPQENSRNMGMMPGNKSGRTGVSWCASHSSWRAHIRHSGRNNALGTFRTFEGAVAAREQAEKEFGFYVGHGLP